MSIVNTVQVVRMVAGATTVVHELHAWRFSNHLLL